MDVNDFQDLVWQKGRELYRDMPWRADTRPYYVLVSEMMLQQTQVQRVIPKFNEFIAAFPDVETLANASLADVLMQWSGLGYNRRAKFLHQAAKKIASGYNALFPDDLSQLDDLPGVGSNTAGAIIAYSFNQPVVFIETNIRTVFFHHFFTDIPVVDDSEIRALVEQTLDRENPKQWYWALMDYGAYLKKQGSGRLDQSKHYKKQPGLKGSIREVRGQIIRSLTTGEQTLVRLRTSLKADERFDAALAGLQKDGLIVRRANKFHLTK